MYSPFHCNLSILKGDCCCQERFSSWRLWIKPMVSVVFPIQSMERRCEWQCQISHIRYVEGKQNMLLYFNNIIKLFVWFQTVYHLNLVPPYIWIGLLLLFHFSCMAQKHTVRDQYSTEIRYQCLLDTGNLLHTAACILVPFIKCRSTVCHRVLSIRSWTKATYNCFQKKLTLEVFFKTSFTRTH